MKKEIILLINLIFHLLFLQVIYGQGVSPTSKEVQIIVPDFYKGKLSDIEAELKGVKKGEVEIIATSPGGLPIYAVYYGEKENFKSQANYNSAIGARNPAYYAQKIKENKPVVYFIGPVHGQEAEGIVGLINLIHIGETGKDHRGKEWPELQHFMNHYRVIIIPCGNPDGRTRCPYDSFVGLPGETMTKYGQGTQTDGNLWRWPKVKSMHPMAGDVGILGAYFNNDGINIMHDDFFFPMAEETKAILKIAKDEAPDMTVSLHSHSHAPCILEPAYLPFFMKERVAVLANNLNAQFQNSDLPHWPDGWQMIPTSDDEKFPPRKPFNLVSALHHVSGTMSFTFECCHGVINDKMRDISHSDILDVQLTLYQEMFEYLNDNRLYWETN